MKNLNKILMLVLLTASFAACSLLDVEKEATLSGDLDIVILESNLKAASAYPFEASTTINPREDETVDKYADKIKSIVADGVIATVESVNKSDVVILKGSKFTIRNSTDEVNWVLQNDWPIEAGTELTLEDVGGIYESVTKILDTLDKFTVSTEGTCSTSGVTIVIRLDIETTVTANPI